MKASKKLPLIFSVLAAVSAFPAIAATAPKTSPSATPLAQPPTQISGAAPQIGTAGVSIIPVTVPSNLLYRSPVDLGTLGLSGSSSIPSNPASYAYSLNNIGQVVGSTGTPYLPGAINWTSYFKSFIWQNNAMQFIPPVNPENKASEAVDINNSSVAIGTDWGNMAYSYQNGVSQILPHLSIKNRSWALGISDSGKIVGASYATDGKYHAVKWQHGVITDLGMLSGYPLSIAYGTSDSGAFTVGISGGKVPVRAIAWDQNNTISILDNDPNVTYAKAIAVNNSGVAVGSASFGLNSSVPVRWINGQTEKLIDTLGEAKAVNNLGQIVGWYTPLGYSKPFIWDNGNAYDLNTLIPPNTGWVLWSANAINDKGEIVGEGVFNGFHRGFLLKPHH